MTDRPTDKENYIRDAHYLQKISLLSGIAAEKIKFPT